MLKDKTSAWSYFSSTVLAFLVLFVFWALQNYGPESTVRRFHTVVARICSYVPSSQPYHPRLLKQQDLLEIAQLTGGAQGSPELAALIDGIIRPSIYLKKTRTYPRTDYKTSRNTLVVVVYRLPNGREDAAVFVIDKPDQSWKINAKDTALLLRSLNPQPAPSF